MARMSRAQQAQMPPAVRAALEAVLGESIARIRIIEHSRLARLHGRALATTRRRCIYLSGSAQEFFANPWLMLHEYCHVLHQWERGRLSVPRYLIECLRRGYWHNRFEVEAREFADRHSAHLHAQLQRTAVQPSSASRR
jgi:uncharacterized protein DUF4157